MLPAGVRLHIVEHLFATVGLEGITGLMRSLSSYPSGYSPWATYLTDRRAADQAMSKSLANESRNESESSGFGEHDECDDSF